MDFSEIIVAVLAFIGTLIGSALANSKTTALITYRIDQLEEKVSKHNTIVERTYKLERDVSTAFTKMDGLKEDVEEMKKGKA